MKASLGKRLVFISICLLLLALPVVGSAATDAVHNYVFGPSTAALLGTQSSTAAQFTGNGAWRETFSAAKFELYIDPVAVFGSTFTIDQIASLTYHTNNVVAPGNIDFFAVLYTTPCTGGDASWYCHRLTAEPMYFNNYVPPTAGVWNTYTTAVGPNQFTFYDYNRTGAYGFYPQPTLQDIQAGPITWSSYIGSGSSTPVDYGSDTVKYISFQTGSATSALLDGYLDAITVVLTTGETYNIDLEDTPAEVWVDDSWAGSITGAEVAAGKFFNYNAFVTIQGGIDAVGSGGTVNVYPGVYDETAANRTIYNSQVYQFGLFFGQAKPGIKVQGVKADGSLITSYNDVATTITTNATNSFGTSGVFVEANDITMSGLGIGRNIPGDNKTIEVIGENFTLKNSVVDVPDGGSVYINDWRYDAGANDSYVEKYTVESNWLKQGTSVDVSSGAGYTGSAVDRKIINNKFTATGSIYAMVSFNGIVPSVGWFTYPVGGATVTGNDFSGSTQYIRSRGTVNEASFDWAAYWNGNTFDKAAMATTDGNPAHPRAYEYMSGSSLMTNVRRIGATIQGEVDNAQAGDTVLVKAGTYVEQVSLGKTLTLKGANAGIAGDAARGPESIVDADLVSAAFAFTADGIVIDGFKVQKGGGSLNCGIHAPASFSGYAIRNNIITDNVMGIYANSDGAATVENNLFDGNNRVGPSGGSGIYSEFSQDLTVAGNKFVHHTENNPVIFAATAPGAHINLAFTANILDNEYGVYAVALNGAVFDGNQIDSNDATALHLGDSSSNVQVLSNKLANSARGLRIRDDGYWGAVGTHKISNVVVHGNSLAGNTDYGLLVAADSYIGTVNAEANWWGSACGPSGMGPGTGSAVSAQVDFAPWWITATGGGSSSGGTTIPAGASAAEQMAIIGCAGPGATITYEKATYPGGVTITTNGVTLNLNGSTIGHGTSAYIIDADDVTIMGPGTLDGGNDPAAAIQVLGGADNFTLKNMDVRKWGKGVEIVGNVVSLKIVDNFIYDNLGAGLQVNSGVTIGGVINVYGNLFKVNGGNGIQNDGVTNLPALYNSWGDIDGSALVTGGDGVSGNVDASQPTFLEYFMDMVPDTLATSRRAASGSSFDVMLKGDARKVNGIAFKLLYNSAVLQLNSATYQGTWAGAAASCLTPAPVAGVVEGACFLTTGEWDGDAAPILKLDFTVLTLPSSPYPSALDILHSDAVTNAGAYGGAKVYVNNAGYGLPSDPARDIKDTNDGELILGNLANYTGYVDLQGRANESGATLLTKNVADKAASVSYASGTSVSGGAYTTAHLSPWVMFQGETFWLQFDRALYLPTTAMMPQPGIPSPPAPPATWQHSKLLLTAPTTPLLSVILLGGDGTDDDAIDILDAGCMGNSYRRASVCVGGPGASSDVNGDGLTDILDLSLMGGNYYKAASPWTP